VVLVITSRRTPVVVAVVVSVPVAPVTVHIAWPFPVAISAIPGTVTDALAVSVTLPVPDTFVPVV
jgi:hypothetical protein